MCKEEVLQGKPLHLEPVMPGLQTVVEQDRYSHSNADDCGSEGGLWQTSESHPEFFMRNMCLQEKSRATLKMES